MTDSLQWIMAWLIAAAIVLSFYVISPIWWLIKRFGFWPFISVACIIAIIAITFYMISIPLPKSEQFTTFGQSTSVATQDTDVIVFESEPSPTPRS